MRTRSAESGLAIALAMLGILTGSCKYHPPSVDGARLRMRLTEAMSPKEIEDMVRASLAEKYASTNIAKGYTMYQLTNGPARWVFAKAYNAPRGLAMFNLYCYEWEKPDVWLLRGYVPVNEYYYTNGYDPELKIQIDNEYVKVVFRGVVIFTITSNKNMATRPVDK